MAAPHIHQAGFNVHQALMQQYQFLQQQVPGDGPTGTEAISCLHQNGNELQHMLQNHTAFMCHVVAGQVQPSPQQLLLHASSILSKSHFILESSKSLLREGIDAHTVASYLQVAELGLTMCTTQLAEAAQMIDENDEGEGEGEGMSAAAALHNSRAGQQVLSMEQLVRLLLLRQQRATAAGQAEEDEELQDTCTSGAMPAHLDA